MKTPEQMWDEIRFLVSEELSALRSEPRDPESDKQLKRLETVTKILKHLPTTPALETPSWDLSDEEADRILNGPK